MWNIELTFETSLEKVIINSYLTAAGWGTEASNYTEEKKWQQRKATDTQTKEGIKFNYSMKIEITNCFQLLLVGGGNSQWESKEQQLSTKIEIERIWRISTEREQLKKRKYNCVDYKSFYGMFFLMTC